MVTSFDRQLMPLTVHSPRARWLATPRVVDRPSVLFRQRAASDARPYAVEMASRASSVRHTALAMNLNPLRPIVLNSLPIQGAQRCYSSSCFRDSDTREEPAPGCALDPWLSRRA